MGDKYKLTDETIVHKGVTLYRIQALRDIVRNEHVLANAGDLGGYVRSTSNLSQFDSSWVHDNAKVYESAIVGEHGEVKNEAEVYGYAIVRGFGSVTDRANVCGYVCVCDTAAVTDKAFVSGSLCLDKDIWITQRVTKQPITIDGLNYPVVIMDNHLQAGCQTHTFNKWRKFTKKQIRAMADDAEDFYPTLMVMMEAALKMRKKNIKKGR